MKIIFKKESLEDNQFDTETVEISLEAESIDRVCECFENFLKACGFRIGNDQRIELVDYPEEAELGQALSKAAPEVLGEE